MGALTSREIASLFWLSVFLIVAVSVPGVRGSLKPLLRALAAPRILASFALLIYYTAAVIRLGSYWSLWDSDLLKDTSIWFFATAVVMFFSLQQAMESPRYFRKFTLRAVEIPVAIQFVADLYPLSLWFEIPLQGILIFMAVLAVVANASEDSAQNCLGRVLNFGLAVSGLGILIASVVQLVRLWRELSPFGLLKQFALPIWLTLVLLPFMYLLALVAAYGKAFSLVNARGQGGAHSVRAKWALVLVCGLNVYRIRRAGRAMYQITHAESLASARQVLEASLREQALSERERKLDAKRLEWYAGDKGLDAEGLPLDRREVNVTIDVLEYLSYCHMGHYYNLGYYREDLVELIGDTFKFRGLPQPHGIGMEVAQEGKKWFAWRVLPSGWTLGIGASGPPSSQWKWDGPGAPKEPPSPAVDGWMNSVEPYPGVTLWR